MANKILVARGTKARIETIKETLSSYELVYALDTKELGVKNADGTITYFGVVHDNTDISNYISNYINNYLISEGLPKFNGTNLTDLFDSNRNLTWDIDGKMNSDSEYVNMYTSTARDFTMDYNTNDGYFLLNGVIYAGSKFYSHINIKEQGIYTVSISKIGGHSSGGSFYLRSDINLLLLSFSPEDTEVVERVELDEGVHWLSITTFSQVDFENLKLEIQIERYGIKTSFKKPTEEADYDELPFENQEEYDEWFQKYKDIKTNGSAQFLLEGSNRNEIKKMNERISLIEDNVTLPAELKPYYIEAIEDKELEALSNVTKDTLDFVVLTDVQQDDFENDTYGQIGVFEQIERYTNNNKVDFVINLGDWIAGNYLKEDTVKKLEAVGDYFNKLNVNKLLTIGNHDDGSYGPDLNELDYSKILSKDELYKVLFRPNLMEGCRFNNKDPNGLYYYKDFEGHNVRVIVLDSIDYPEVYDSNGYLKYRGQNSWGFAKKQIEWLAYEALNLKKSKVNYQDWQVMIMTHISIGDKVSYYGYTSQKKNWEIVYGVVNAFINGSAYVGESDDYVEEPVSINVDFNEQGIVPFIGWFSGHSHIDITGKDPEHEFTTRALVCATSSNRRSTTGNASVGEYYTYERPQNSKQTTAFDVVSINLRERKVKITRIGAGNDAEFSY